MNAFGVQALLPDYRGLRLRIKDSFKGSFTGLQFMNFGVWVILPDFRVLRVPLRGLYGFTVHAFGVWDLLPDLFTSDLEFGAKDLGP